jgi:catechol 2,3-dioxygenase
MLNTETIVHPRLQHLSLTTGRADEMIHWYRTVLGMNLLHRNENPTGAAEVDNPGILAAWLSNDEVHHRIAILGVPGLSDDPQRSTHPRVQHFGFEYPSLDDLLGTWARLAEADILPVLTVDEGLQTAFYYFDPDRNCVELNTNNYGSNLSATEHLQHSPEFAGRPLGQSVDPALMIAARAAGATAWDIHKRAWQQEFAPANPANPAVLF